MESVKLMFTTREGKAGDTVKVPAWRARQLAEAGVLADTKPSDTPKTDSTPSGKTTSKSSKS